MTATKFPGLVSALASIQTELPIVRKGETAEVPTKSGGKYSYTYADLSDVVKAVYPLLAGAGLVFVTRPKFTESRYVLIGQLEHESGESRDAEFPLPDRGTPQELGSAITYGRRYLLGCLTGVVTGDDDDGAAAPKRPAQTSQPEKPTAPTPASIRSEIAAIGRGGSLKPDEIADDYAAWSEGQLIGEADVDMLTKYRAYLENRVATR